MPKGLGAQAFPPPLPQYLAFRLDIPALCLLELVEASLEEAAAALGHDYERRTLSPPGNLVGACPRPPLPWSLTVVRRGAPVHKLEELAGRGLHRLSAGPASHGQLGEGEPQLSARSETLALPIGARGTPGPQVLLPVPRPRRESSLSQGPQPAPSLAGSEASVPKSDLNPSPKSHPTSRPTGKFQTPSTPNFSTPDGPLPGSGLPHVSDPSPAKA